MSTSGSSWSTLCTLRRTLALKFAASELFRASGLSWSRCLFCIGGSVILETCVYIRRGGKTKARGRLSKIHIGCYITPLRICLVNSLHGGGHPRVESGLASKKSGLRRPLASLTWSTNKSHQYTQTRIVRSINKQLPRSGPFCRIYNYYFVIIILNYYYYYYYYYQKLFGWGAGIT